MSETKGERLERIASDWYNEDSIDNKDVDWLIEQTERVEEAGKTIDEQIIRTLESAENTLIRIAEKEKLREEIVQLREDFAFYADKESYIKCKFPTGLVAKGEYWIEPVMEDGGAKARQALERESK